MIAPAEANDMIDSTDPAEPTDRIEPVEPIERIECDEPIERIERVDPIERIERSLLARAVRRIRSLRQAAGAGAARLMSSTMRASTSGVISRTANDVAHIGPSSSWAGSSKLSVP